MAHIPSSEELAKENEVELKVEAEQENPPARPPLEKFVPKGGELYEAMEFFLLSSPKRQILQGGDADALEKSADAAMKAGNSVAARIDYEAAAKVALYQQDKQKFGEMLERAEKATPQGEKFSKLHQALLANVDEAMRISREYYDELDSSLQ